MTKVSNEALEKLGFFTTHLLELFKNHKIMKIFQNENFEKTRSKQILWSKR